ncbi:hypothetical protein EDB89DRAFT_1901321 [Lactarius sanguifluus]|nr:hypothetical protein EDB89DRAFT_1901321 [Lactarius sanguifluus]
MPQSKASNTTDSDASSGPKTNYAYTKPYGGMKGFMESHGLKLWNDDDVQEAKAILDGYREMDAAATETDKANSNFVHEGVSLLVNRQSHLRERIARLQYPLRFRPFRPSMSLNQSKAESVQRGDDGVGGFSYYV